MSPPCRGRRLEDSSAGRQCRVETHCPAPAAGGTRQDPRQRPASLAALSLRSTANEPRQARGLGFQRAGSRQQDDTRAAPRACLSSQRWRSPCHVRLTGASASARETRRSFGVSLLLRHRPRRQTKKPRFGCWNGHELPRGPASYPRFGCLSRKSAASTKKRSNCWASRGSGSKQNKAGASRPAVSQNSCLNFEHKV
jgi:hypothetical protein